eukprot:scaffold678213_cov65-Prasinocladus_malaysianus.AAC.1
MRRATIGLAHLEGRLRVASGFLSHWATQTLFTSQRVKLIRTGAPMALNLCAAQLAVVKAHTAFMKTSRSAAQSALATTKTMWH